MGNTIAIFNQKGGVGKTTTAVNLAAYLGKKDKKTLLVDLDPQGNATSGFGIDKKSLNENIYHSLNGVVKLDDILLESGSKNLKIAPSGIELAGIEIEFSDKKIKWQTLFRDIIAEIKDEYDYIIVDCPPSLGMLSIMGLVGSDYVIIPIQAEFYALEGTSQLLDTISMVRENFNSAIEILGVLICMYDARTRLSTDVLDEVKYAFGEKVFNTRINRNVRLAEAPSYGKSIFDYDNLSKGAWNYRALTKEVMERIEGQL